MPGRALTPFCPPSPSIGGSIPIVFSYFSEFLAQEKRGEHLSWLCMFWMIGGIYASAMAWAIIPHYGKNLRVPEHAASLVGLSTITTSLSHLRRLELPDGLSVPVPQLEGLRPGLRLPLGLRHRGAHHHAREPPLLPGGERTWGVQGRILPGTGWWGWGCKQGPQVGGGTQAGTLSQW